MSVPFFHNIMPDGRVFPGADVQSQCRLIHADALGQGSK